MEEKNKGGRPRKPVDEHALEVMARNHVPDGVIAKALQISEDTLHRRYAEKVDEWKSDSKAKLAAVLWEEGMLNRKEWALKILVQRWLGYAEKSHLQIDTNILKPTAENVESLIDIVRSNVQEHISN